MNDPNVETARKAVIAAAEAWTCGSAGGLQHSRALDDYGDLREQRGRDEEIANTTKLMGLRADQRNAALARAEQAEAALAERGSQEHARLGLLEQYRREKEQAEAQRDRLLGIVGEYVQHQARCDRNREAGKLNWCQCGLNADLAALDATEAPMVCGRCGSDGGSENENLVTNIRSEGVRPVGMHLNLDDVESRLEAALEFAPWAAASERPIALASLADIGPLVARVRAADAFWVAYQARDHCLSTEDHDEAKSIVWDPCPSCQAGFTLALREWKAACAGDREGRDA